MTISYRDLKAKGNSMILEKEENVSIEQNETSFIKRRHTFVKEKFHCPIGFTTKHKRESGLNNHSTSIEEDIDFVREIKKTQVNLKNLSDSIMIQMKKLKHQRHSILKNTGHICRNSTAIRNDLTWDQNLGQQNTINECNAFVSNSPRVPRRSHQPETHLTEKIEDQFSQINNTLDSCEAAYKSLIIKADHPNSLRAYNDCDNSDVLSSDNVFKLERSQSRKCSRLRRKYKSCNGIICKQSSYRENAVTPSAGYNYIWDNYQCQLPSHQDSDSACESITNVDNDIQQIKIKCENTSAEQYCLSGDVYCKQCTDLFSKEIKYTSQRSRVSSPNAEKSCRSRRKINVATNTNTNSFKRNITPVWRQATESIETKAHKINSIPKQEKNKEYSNVEKQLIIKNKQTLNIEVEDPNARKEIYEPHMVDFESDLSFETLRNLRKMQIKPYKAIKYYSGDKYNIHVLPQKTKSNHQKVSVKGKPKTYVKGVTHENIKKLKTGSSKESHIKSQNDTMTIKDKMTATQEKYKKVREELNKQSLKDDHSRKSIEQLPQNEFQNANTNQFDEMKNMNKKLEQDQDHLDDLLIIPNSITIRSSIEQLPQNEIRSVNINQFNGMKNMNKKLEQDQDDHSRRPIEHLPQNEFGSENTIQFDGMTNMNKKLEHDQDHLDDLLIVPNSITINEFGSANTNQFDKMQNMNKKLEQDEDHLDDLLIPNSITVRSSDIEVGMQKEPHSTQSRKISATKFDNFDKSENSEQNRNSITKLTNSQLITKPVIQPKSISSKIKLPSQLALPSRMTQSRTATETQNPAQFVPVLEPDISHASVQPPLQRYSFTKDASQMADQLSRLSFQLSLQKQKFQDASQLVKELSNLKIELLPERENPDITAQSEDMLHLKYPIGIAFPDSLPQQKDLKKNETNMPGLSSQSPYASFIKQASLQNILGIPIQESSIQHSLLNNIESANILPTTQNEILPIELQPSSNLNKLEQIVNSQFLKQNSEKSSAVHDFQKITPFGIQSNSDISLQAVQESKHRAKHTQKNTKQSDTESTDSSNDFDLAMKTSYGKMSPEKSKYYSTYPREKIKIKNSSNYASPSKSTKSDNYLPFPTPSMEEQERIEEHKAESLYNSSIVMIENSDSDTYYDLECTDSKISLCLKSVSLPKCLSVLDNIPNDIEAKLKTETYVDDSLKQIKVPTEYEYDAICQQKSIKNVPYQNIINIENICKEHKKKNFKCKKIGFRCDRKTPYGQSIPQFTGCPCMYATYQNLVKLCYGEHKCPKENKQL